MVNRNAAPQAIEQDKSSVPAPRIDDELINRDWKFKYDAEYDTLRIVVGIERPAVAVDIEGEMWLRLDPATGEILGFEIEDFKTRFVTAHPEMNFLPTDKRGSKNVKPPVREAPIYALIEFVRRVCGDGGTHRGHFQAV